MIKKNPIIVLGEEIDPDNEPILYRWAKTNPDTLRTQLVSLTKALGGSTRAAIINLENDLERG